MKSNFSKGLLMTALITGSVIWGGTNVFAEELQEYTLDQMVVTATRTEKKIIDVPASVEVLTAKDIEKSGATYIDDALKKVTGIAVSRTGGLANSKSVVTMRGVKSGSDVLVLVDGQPMVNAYSGTVNWNDIPVESIEKIEVVKGPGSAIYGSNAMAGVINITTKDSEKMHAKTSLTYGTNHTWIKKVNVGDKVGKFGYDLYYQGTDSHTYSDMTSASVSKRKEANEPEGGTLNKFPLSPTTTGGKQAIIGKKGNKIWDEDNYKGKFTYKFDDSKTLSLGYMKTKNEYTYDYRSHERWIDNGTYNLTGSTAKKSEYFSVSDKSFDAAPGGVDERIYTIGYADKDAGLHVNAGLTDNRSWNGGVYSGGTSKTDLSKYNSKRYTMGVTKEVQLSNNDYAVFGLQYQHDKMDKVKLKSSDFKTISQAGEGKTDMYGIFFQDEHKFNDKVSLIGALRYDHWTVKDGHVYDVNGMDDKPDSRSDSALSPKLALNYKFDDTQSAYVSWGRAFSAPSLYDMFSGTVNGKIAGSVQSSKTVVIPNPGLKPQIITTTEAGYKKSISDKTSIQMAVFHNKIKNINYQGDTGRKQYLEDDDHLYDSNGSMYAEKQLTSNGEGKTIGFEIGLTHQFDDKLSAYVNATIQNPQITKGASAKENDKIVRTTPKRLLNIGVDYVDNKFSAELAGNYYSKKYGKADNSDTITGVPGAYDPVFLMSFTSKYNFDKHHGLEFSVFNLLDREYYNYSLGQGRNFLLTYSYTF